MKVKLIVKRDDSVLGEFVFDDGTMSADTASQMVAYGLKEYPTEVTQYLDGSGVQVYNNEDIERTLTMLT